jgi:hypothetical protein
MNLLKILWVGGVLLVAGCATITTDDYAHQKPTLDIRHYLNGPLEAAGILYDIHGKADLQFHVSLVGKWDGNTGILTEHFVYSDGRKDERVWTIRFTDAHHFTATAHDVEGEAIGSQNGNTVNMQYVLYATRATGDTIDLTMDDWMYLLDAKTLINRTQMRKFGVKVGELVITFRKP